MANSGIGSIGNYGNLTGAAAYGSGTPSASVLAKVERTLASQAGSVARLNTSLLRDQTKLSGLGQLQSALTGFQSIAERLAGSGLSTTATASGKGVLNVSASGTRVVLRDQDDRFVAFQASAGCS
eukprot:gene22287-28403_t